VVTGIAATARAEVVFEGRAGHAGTTPMPRRDDALVAAAELVLRLRDAAAAVDGAVATVGRFAVEPGASNVIPSRVAFERRRAGAGTTNGSSKLRRSCRPSSGGRTRWRWRRRRGRRCSIS
jgi:acetylornithine deacetylase/succinyl-diaminopimelate desuccinylase-like protein